MEAVFIVCATAGGTVLIIQFILALIGLGGEALDIDVPQDAGHDFGGVDFHGDVGGGDLHGDMAGGDFHGDAGAHGAHDGHAAAHHGSTWLFGVLSFRTIVAALAFFGLAGLAAQAADVSMPGTLGIAVGAGFAAMMGVYWMMRGLSNLKAEGTMRIHRATGRHGTVYLTVPGEGKGSGKIQLNLQNRTAEFLAVTEGPALPTGTKVVVTGVVDAATVAVERIE